MQKNITSVLSDRVLVALEPLAKEASKLEVFTDGYSRSRGTVRAFGPEVNGRLAVGAVVLLDPNAGYVVGDGSLLVVRFDDLLAEVEG